MAQAKWYTITPLRRQLLAALVTAILVFGYFLGRSIDSAKQVFKPNEPEQKLTNPVR